MILVSAIDVDPQPPLSRLQHDIRFADLQFSVLDDAPLDVVQRAFQLQARQSAVINVNTN